MMTQEEAKQLLETAFEEIFSGSAYSGARKAYGRLKIYESSRSMATARNLYPTAWGRVSGIPAVLLTREKNRLVLIAGSGGARMNPALVELLFTETAVTVNAWGKEGLIKQHTAEKAVDACLSALGLI